MQPPQDLRRSLVALIQDEPPTTSEGPGVSTWLARMCRVATRALPASGVSVSLMAAADVRGVSAASDGVSELVEELQFTLGEGPCRDAYAVRRPVLATHLSREQARWPAYASAAQNHGVEAVFAFPMQVGSARLGVLDVYRREAGALTDGALAQALMFADVTLISLLTDAGQSESGHREAGSLFDLGADDAHRLEVHQAQGMLTVQLGVGLDEAMVRLRAYAFAADRPLSDVARDVINRQLVFDRDDD